MNPPCEFTRRGFTTRLLAALGAVAAAAGSRRLAAAADPPPPPSPAAAMPPADPADAALPTFESDMSMYPPESSRPDQIAILVYHRCTAQDVIGPQHMFASLLGATVRLVAKTREPILTDTGVRFLPDCTLDECPRDLTVICAPGGTGGTLAAMRDADTLAFLADRGGQARFVTSVCTGSLLLGAAGLLKGYRATSHWSTRPLLTRFGAIPTDERVVRDRNRVTGAGVTAGLDFGLTLVSELRDRRYAETVQLIAEYDPQPPFQAGSPAKAPAPVREMMTRMSAGFVAKADEFARAASIQP